jgi:hypothetical protein
VRKIDYDYTIWVILNTQIVEQYSDSKLSTCSIEEVIMKIGPINLLSGISGKERIQMLQDFKTAYEEQKLKRITSTIKLADNALQIIPVKKSLPQQPKELSLVDRQDYSLDSPVLKPNQEPKDLKTLAELDNTSQEMLQNFSAFERPPPEFLPPEKKISSASSTIDELNKSERQAPPQPPLFEPKPINIFDKKEPLSVPKPGQSILTNLEMPILEVPIDHIFSPNRKNALPPHRLPADISYVYDPKELETLENLQETQTLLQKRRKEEVFEVPRSEEDFVPPSSLYQPLESQGKTKPSAVENPDELIASGKKTPLQELQHRISKDILATISTGTI